MQFTQKGIDTKNRIVDAALALFARKGFAATGLRELANEAGVNLAMINYFFGSKMGLLKDILDTFFNGYSSIMQQHLRGPGKPEEKLRHFIGHAVVYFNENRDGLIIALTELPHDDPEITEYKAIWARKIMVMVKEEICTPLEKTSGVAISPAVIGPLLVSMMSSRFLFAPIIETVDPAGLNEEFLGKYSELVTNIFLEGIGRLTDDSDGG